MSEREQFEAWASDNNEWPQCIERSGDSYKLMQTKLKWEAWQAARAQPAQAVPVLTDAEIDTAYEKARADYQRSRFAVRGQQLTAQDSPDWWFARAIEQAVRAKMGVAQWLPIETAPKDCGFLGYQPLTDDMWILAPMYWAGSEFLLLQFHHGDTEHSMTPTHWMPLPPPPGIVGKEGA